MGSAETCGWTIRRGGRREVLAESRRTLPDYSQPETKHRPDEDHEASQAGFWGEGLEPLQSVP